MDEKTVEKEIQEFLSIENKNKDEEIELKDEIKNTDMDKLINLLTKLEEYYKQINNSLEKAEYEELKRNNLKEMIESTLICDSIMKVLKEVSIERNIAIENEKKTKAMVEILEKEKNEITKKCFKVEEDLKYMKNANGELLRLIQDQKQKLSDFKHKSEYEKKALSDIKILNEELEALRKKALNKVSIMEKEKEILEEQLLQKDNKLKEIAKNLEKKENEDKLKNNSKIALEKKIEELRKTIDAKNNSLSMCNDELSKLLSKEKRMSTELQNVKEKATYYEKLYNSLNKQNEYLNSQLSRMINAKDFDSLKVIEEKEEDIENSKERIIKYKKSRNKLKKKENEYLNKLKEKENKITDLLEKLKIQEDRIESMKEEIIENRNKNRPNAEIYSKMEKLLKKNKEYENRIRELEEKKEKEEIFYDVISPKTEVKEEKNLPNTEYQYYLDKKEYPSFPNTYTNKNFINKKTDSPQQDKNYQDNMGNFWKRYMESKDQSKKIKDSLFLNENKKEEKNTTEFYNDIENIKDDFISPKYENKKEEKDESDDKDTNSTTSTLKNMKKRTELLQSKFDKLNTKLEEIKNKESPTPEKIKDQIKEYTNYYYSDFLDVSNDSDFI